MEINEDVTDGSRALESLYRMWTIRLTEDNCERLFQEGKIRGAMHLYSGQEAVAVGACDALTDVDRIVFTYRSHGWALARGMRIDALFGELFGRADGCCHGRAGSKNLCDWSRGIFPGNAIVAAGLPLANGLGFAAKRLGERRVVVTAFGEGATNQGVFHEALAQAVLWKLPVVFVCENNLYAELTPAHEMRPVADLLDVASSSGIDRASCDGMDVQAVEETVRMFADRARDGGGPAFVEAKTYRFCGHMTGDGQRYRSTDEVDEWRRRDPLVVLGDRLKAAGATAERVSAARDRAEADVEAAIRTAWDMPEPDPSSILDFAPSWAEASR